ncbi:MAG: bifunctional hydroxymethylpyrimidine kinase/phosphomethylpyrimidine kinase [Alphaproteobacteria bacterium]|nr:bifunctional hydroxymethylpyrimidine kinase/phosphomethylpyrimidine kinase [Alphaproteobacteria bacterium]MCY4317670.1 bifunctional hydroxymethylpyrimidine kinase/phosphomethylpyrimidine kinase [Alphaproteobacteria bacterium]
MGARGRLLIVAGSDSGGGAGIQADIKTCTALGGYAMTAVTALTAQNTEGVHGVHPVPPGFIADQMRVVLRDIGADAVKTGMLHDAETIEAVAETLKREALGVPVVVDPVMVAKGGHALLRADAVEALRRCMLPLAALLTPNMPEAEALLDGRPPVWPSWAALGAGAVLLKDGHGTGILVCDRLLAAGGETVFEHERLATKHTHGTGCTLASAAATGLAQGFDLASAVRRAGDFVHAAMRSAPGLGRGHGPLNHMITVRRFA